MKSNINMITVYLVLSQYYIYYTIYIFFIIMYYILYRTNKLTWSFFKKMLGTFGIYFVEYYIILSTTLWLYYQPHPHSPNVQVIKT